ncbi:flagellar biosynthetic protein FliR [Mariniblastus fucicola]|uniref:Flagellar biosynthesis protein FliR n=1 Tax=Mariniblastus fucicola TaxID=980251 RepID=A0A5B9PG24_9BACT|nr:flagellar biosynthetic protein FliR [Mariniblastus fucicola]QEG24180.1 flagellar biosynthesis protein FliR [Mariniblastus fucicola]
MVSAFLLVFFRIAAMVFTAPILGSKAVSAKHRVLVSLVLAGVSFSAMPQAATNAIPLDANFIAPLASEISIGVSLGLGTMIIFSAAQMAGNILGQLAGLQFFDQLDPTTGGTSSPVGQLFGLTSLATFALMNGPDLVVGSVLHTFHQLPPGTAIASVGLLELIPQILQQSFILSISGVGPGIAAMLVTSITFGFVCRTFPQMNLTSLALGSNVSIMFLAIFLTLGGCIWLFVDDLGPTLEQIQSVFVSSATGFSQ